MKHHAFYSFIPVAFFAFFGLLTPAEITGTAYLYLSPADFNPHIGSCPYINWGGYLTVDGLTACDFYAGIQIPDGSVITALWIHFKDGSAQEMTAHLYENNHDGSSDDLGSVSSYGSTNVDLDNLALTSIAIDNVISGYFVGLKNLNNQMRFNLLRITYTYTIPWYAYPLYLPMIRQ